MKAESERLLKSMGLENGGIDAIFLHVLEAVGAVSTLAYNNMANKDSPTYNLDAAKFRIFWKTMREIAEHEIVNENNLYKRSSCLGGIVAAFPDKKKKTDGRMWLPLHFAMTVPSIDLADIQTLIEHDPESIKHGYKSGENLNPCHLAVMAKDPNMALINQLVVFDPEFGTRVTRVGNSRLTKLSTPLHLAAQFSSSVAVIDELIRVCPAALEMRDALQNTPLCRCISNVTPEASIIMQTIMHAAPQTATTVGANGNTPLHQLLMKGNLVKACQEDMVNILLRAFPDALSFPNEQGMLPLQVAAQHCGYELFIAILKSTPINITYTSTIAHYAARGGKMDNISFIRILFPMQFLLGDDENRTPLHWAIRSCQSNPFIGVVVSIAPVAARIVDTDGDNLLHVLCHHNPYELDTMSGMDLMRLLLCLIPGGALATNQQGMTPYDMLDAGDTRYVVARRLLLLAGASSLHPETMKQMNYEARKEALFAFFGTRREDHNHIGKEDVCHRIRHGEGAMELMRQIISFL